MILTYIFAEKLRANSNQNQPPALVPDNNKNGSLTTTPVKANGKRIRNGESPVSIAKFPLKGKCISSLIVSAATVQLLSFIYLQLFENIEHYRVWKISVGLCDSILDE